eukprot:121578_1
MFSLLKSLKVLTFSAEQKFSNRGVKLTMQLNKAFKMVYNIPLRRVIYCKHLTCFGYYRSIINIQHYNLFSTKTESSGQQTHIDYNEQNDKQTMDEEEYYDEYTDTEEFEDDEKDWVYDDEGVARDIKTGEPVMMPIKNEEKLPHIVSFFLRTLGLIALFAITYQLKWYNGSLTWFGSTYKSKNKK